MNRQQSSLPNDPTRQDTRQEIDKWNLPLALVILFVGVNLLIGLWGFFWISFTFCSGSSDSGICGVGPLLVFTLPTLFFLGEGARLIFRHRYWLGAMIMAMPALVWIIAILT